MAVSRMDRMDVDGPPRGLMRSFLAQNTQNDRERMVSEQEWLPQLTAAFSRLTISHPFTRWRIFDIRRWINRMKAELKHRVEARRSYASRMATRMMSKGVRKRTHAGKLVKWSVGSGGGTLWYNPANFILQNGPISTYGPMRRI